MRKVKQMILQVLFKMPSLIGLLTKRKKAGSAEANGREPKTCLGRVFNYKVGHFADVHVFIYVDARPHL